MAKTRKMSPSMDAWRKHVAKVASAEGVKYGDAMKMANKGKYAAEWKQIQASVSKGKKGGMASKLEPAEFKGGNVDEVEVEVEEKTMSGGEPAAYEGKFGFNAAPLKGGRRKSRKSRKTRKSRKGKRGGGFLNIIA